MSAKQPHVVVMEHGFLQRRLDEPTGPPDFPWAEFDGAFRALTRRHSVPDDLVSEFFDQAGTWNGTPLPDGRMPPPAPSELNHLTAGLASVQRRFETSARADEAFRSRVAEWLLQRPMGLSAASVLDEPFFVFYSSTMAVVEGLGYALAWVPFLAGRKHNAPAPRSISFGETAAEFRRVFRNEPITDAIGRLADDRLLSDVRSIRNMLEHRGAASVNEFSAESSARKASVVGMLHSSPYLGRDLVINDDLTAAPRAWIASHLSSVLGSVPGLAEKVLR